MEDLYGFETGEAKRDNARTLHPTQPPFAFGSGGWWVLTLEHDKMRTALCIIFVATLAWAVIADSSVEPQDYTFVIQSPHRGYYAVQVLQSWSFQTNGQPTGRFKLSETGRFEVSRATDGERVWQTNTVLGLMGNLYLADDPDYVVEVAAQLSSCGLTGLHGGKVADAPSDKQQEILNKVALRFYRRGSLLAGHSLRDIDVPVASIEMSVSHVYFFEPMTAQSMGHWDWPVDDLANSTNPRFNKEDRTFSFFGNDKRERVFDYATGKIVRIETKAQADARMRALRDCLTTERKEKASDAPTTPPIVQ